MISILCLTAEIQFEYNFKKQTQKCNKKITVTLHEGIL